MEEGEFKEEVCCFVWVKNSEILGLGKRGIKGRGEGDGEVVVEGSVEEKGKKFRFVRGVLG